MQPAVSRFVVPNSLVVTVLDVSPDGKSIVIGQQADHVPQATLGLWSLADRQFERSLIGEAGIIPLAARFSPRGSTLVFSDAAQDLVLYDLRSGTPNRTAFPLRFTKWLSFAWDGRRLIAGGTKTQVWDADRDGVIWTLPTAALPGNAGIVPPCCALDASGQHVAASGIEPGRIVIYHVDSGMIVDRIEPAMNSARSIAFDPNGRFLVAVGQTGGIRLWDLESRKALLPERLNLATDYYWCARFHPDGERIAFGLWSGFVEVIHLQSETLIMQQEVPPHRGRVWDVAFTPDGMRLLSGGDDGAVLIWEFE
jgi:WD40 repeat protein